MKKHNNLVSVCFLLVRVINNLSTVIQLLLRQPVILTIFACASTDQFSPSNWPFVCVKHRSVFTLKACPNGFGK